MVVTGGATTTGARPVVAIVDAFTLPGLLANRSFYLIYAAGASGGCTGMKFFAVHPAVPGPA
jgi:hypothetical protein